jgi:sterol desaturase/sphingolipid hydroxylase (fatty acid hydroxylase superfamily)
MDILSLIDWRGILIVALIFIPLEHILPLHHEQGTLRKSWLNDVFYLIFNGVPIKLGLMAVLGAAMVAIETYVPAGFHAWVQSWPLLVQVLAVIVVADIGFYAAHRTFHAVPFLWRFHSVHHSIEEMDWLAAHRVHPVDQIITMTSSLLPVYALGFEPLAIGISAFIYHWQSLLIHSNTRINFGPLRWIVASPQFHHWHHANEREAYDKNFAGQLPFIDAIGGTLRMPKQMPTAYGCDDPVPKLYHQQMMYPLLPKEKPAAVPESLTKAG